MKCRQKSRTDKAACGGVELWVKRLSHEFHLISRVMNDGGPNSGYGKGGMEKFSFIQT
jgi:hypothetical protein